MVQGQVAQFLLGHDAIGWDGLGYLEVWHRIISNITAVGREAR